MAQHTIDLPCIADTYVDGNNPNTNYGSALILKTQYQKTRAYLNFDSSSLPKDKKIISVHLKLYPTESVYIGEFHLEINFGINVEWEEHSLTGNNYPGSYYMDSITKIRYRSLSGNIYNMINLPHANPYRLGWGVVLIDYNDVEIKVHSRENTSPPVLSVVYEDVPPSKPTLIGPVGVYKDSASIIKFEWKYNSSVGGEQKKFDLQWSVDQSDWTTISETTQNTYYDMPADTLPAGNIYWRIRTYNEYDEASDYSDTATFYSIGAPNAPTIQSVTNECRPTINWSAFDQQVYQLQVLKNEVVIYDSGELPGINNRSYKIKDFLSDGQYTSKIRIKNEYDLWSNWGENTFTISTTKPDKPSLSIQRSQYGLELTITGEQETSCIYRDNVCIAKVDGERCFDNAVANEKEYQYFIRALTTNGFADSDIVLGTASFRFGLLSTKNEVFELKANLNAIPTKNITNTQPGTMNMYDGRKYPVSELSLNVEQTLTLQYYLKTYAEVEKIIEIADMKETVLYRDRRGRKMYGVITGLSIQDTSKGHNVSITISATDHDEAVEI